MKGGMPVEENVSLNNEHVPLSSSVHPAMHKKLQNRATIHFDRKRLSRYSLALPEGTWMSPGTPAGVECERLDVPTAGTLRLFPPSFLTAHGGALVLAHLNQHTHPSVLIVDQSEDTREVLRAALERRGVQILEAAEARQGIDLARRHHPEVIVLDLECEAADDSDVQAEYDAEAREGTGALVVLGKARRYEDKLPSDRILPKPYHYAPLIRTIERLLDTAKAA
jgi:CheY-like chemotaxis protein